MTHSRTTGGRPRAAADTAFVRRVHAIGKRIARDPALRRDLALIAILIAGLGTGVWLIVREIPQDASLIRNAAAKTAAMLLPLLLIAVAARLPALRRRIRPRYIVRPFGTTSSSSAYDGRGIATMLYRDMLAWPSSGVGRTTFDEADTASLGSAAVKLGVASLPLEWLWTHVRTVLTGRSHVNIGGLIIDSEKPIRVQVWAGRDTWEEVLDESLPDSIGRAISSLTPQVWNSLDPVLAARIQWGRLKHDEAIRLISSHDASLAERLELAEIQLDGDYLAPAERLLNQLSLQITSRKSRVKLYRLQAEVHTRRGSYREARELLMRALDHAQTRNARPQAIARLRTMLADLSVYQHEHWEATTLYDDAFDSGIDELCRLTGEANHEEMLALIVDQPLPADTSTEIVTALWALYWILHGGAHCRSLLDDPERAIEELEVAEDVILTLWPHDTTEEADIQHAVVLKAIARLRKRLGEGDAVIESVAEAVGAYDGVITVRESRIHETQEDDFQAKVDLAWSQFGKGTCLRLLTSEPGNTSSDRDPPGLLVEESRLLRLWVRRLDEPAQGLFIRQFERAQRKADAVPAQHRLLQLSASTLLENALIELDTDELSRAVDDLLGAPAWGSPPPTEAFGVPDLSETALEAGSRAGLHEEEVAELCRAVMHLLHHLVSQDPHQLREAFQIADRLLDIEHCFEECERHFTALTHAGPRRLRAEGFYGLACIHAADGRSEDAERELRRAGVAAGDQTRHYLHRAMLDEDFLLLNESWSRISDEFAEQLPPAWAEEVGIE